MAVREETVEKRWFLDVDKLTDSTTGTAGNTLSDVGATPTQAAINNNFATLNAKLNEVLDRLKATT